MAFLSDTARGFLANQPDPPRPSSEQKREHLRRIRHAERWIREQRMEDMAQIVGRSRDELINEAIDEWLASHELDYRKRQSQINEHLAAIEALQQ
tara:strand:+ start:69 stop:353 length:285 start_codon:yes stop_codon:yes gene_type:complete